MEILRSEDYPSLPKWPALTVTGPRITKEQAAEILIRTDSLSLSGNDDSWIRTLYNEFGIRVSSDGYPFPNSEDLDRVRKELRCLPLDYLTNHRIVSPYIGGPHGWCSWEGTISHNKNIGKWPSVKEVEQEWVVILREFPYLKLVATLFDGESSEDNIRPLVQFHVGDGKVIVTLPENPTYPSVDTSDMVSSLSARFLLGDRVERGCTLETLREAISLTKEAIARRDVQEIVRVQECTGGFLSGDE